MRAADRSLLFFCALIVLVGALAGCQGKGGSPLRENTAPGTSLEAPVAPEKNPPGDIPDSQVFVKFISPRDGVTLEVPEGWSRAENEASVTFTSHYNGLSLAVTPASGSPDAKSVLAEQALATSKSERAVTVIESKDVQTAGGPAVVLDYESNSAPDPVTTKQIRLENQAWFFYRNKKLAELRLWAPLGADNIDQWKRIAGSFKWE